MSTQREFYNKSSDEFCKEISQDDEKLRILYKTFYGRILLKTIFARRYFSYFAGAYYSSKISKNKLLKFFKENNLSEKYNIENYASFNAFFSRKEHRDIKAQNGALLCPADSLVMCFDISENLHLNIKNSNYSLNELLQDKALAQKYIGGVCFVHRLTLKDYHRYIFPDSGEFIAYKHIKGSLHTVRPIGGIKDNYFKNTRCISVLKTKHFGNAVYAQVGAMLIGKITNHKKQGAFLQAEEKGKFEYGGSTIIMLFEKDRLIPLNIIKQMSNSGIETKINLGEHIAYAKKA